MVCADAGLDLLERAVIFAVARAGEVTPGQHANLTPCVDWNLRELLTHTRDSARVLREAIRFSRVGLIGSGRHIDPAAALRAEAALLLSARAAGGAERQVAVDDRSLTVGLV